MSETKSLTAGTTLAHLLKGCRQQTEKAAKACPEARRLYQLGPNKATPLWLVGHLANTAEFIGNILGVGSPSGAIQPDWRKKFTPEFLGGSPITASAADYPSWDETLDAYGKVLAHLIEETAKLTDEQLLGAANGKIPPPLASMLTNLQDCITLNIIHDSHHRGQLALLANAPG